MAPLYFTSPNPTTEESTYRKVVNAVDSLLVAAEGEVRRTGTQLPDLDLVVERARRKRVRVLGVEQHLHHIVRVALKNLFMVWCGTVWNSVTR